MKKNPKFFCENCNQEVRRDALVCPHCGRFFASVRCPMCHYTGTHKDFKEGCPNCGYSISGSSKKEQAKKAPPLTPAKRRPAGNDDSLPAWVYRLVLSLTVFVIIICITVIFTK